MKKYEAPQAQVVKFDNDYVATANQHNSGSNGCDGTCKGTQHDKIYVSGN